MNAPADYEALCGAAVFAGGHGFHGNEEIVQAARAGKACLEGCIEDGAGLGQERLRVAQGRDLEEILRGDAGPSVEEAVAMMDAQAQVACDVGQRGLMRGVGIEVMDGLLDAMVVAGWHGVSLAQSAMRRHPILAGKCDGGDRTNEAYRSSRLALEVPGEGVDFCG